MPDSDRQESGFGIRAAEVVLPCAELGATLAFFIERLGFRVAMIFPADAPSVAVISGYGLRVRLERDSEGPPGVLRIMCRDPAALGGGTSELTAPNGTRVLLAPWEPPLSLPPLRPSFVLTRMGAGSGWGIGRAGMRYRDLIPDRQGGRFVASQILIPEGGPVPDYVHFHRVRFQVIYCFRGWVRVVYEDQGPPFVLQAGDCVLQPPGIRHRVLDCSPGLEVIEVASPADHETRADLELELPTGAVRPDRDFGGQRFVRHQASGARWGAGRIPGFESRAAGIAAATSGLASVEVVRRRGGADGSDEAYPLVTHDAELLFFFVLQGSASLDGEGHGRQAVSAGDAFVIPAGRGHALRQCTRDLELLEVALPARFETA